MFGRGWEATRLDVVERFLVLDGDWTRSEVQKLEPLVNKVLLEHRPAHSFLYCLWPLLCDRGRVVG